MCRNNTLKNSSYQVFPDRVIQGPFEAKAISSVEIISNYQSRGNNKSSADLLAEKKLRTDGVSKWKLTHDMREYPRFSSEQLLVDALYNMSLEELLLNIEADGTFRTGAEWEGVWTRDISYSTILSLAILHPEISKNSLRKKVKNGRILQDTGTGGAYPVSTDRVVWAIAAWEIYLVTGDRNWLEEIYPIIKITLEEDILNAFNPKTGLVKGESSFLDWREQSYPDWMQPADIYESETLGTGAVHYKAHEVLAGIAKILKYPDEERKHIQFARKIKEGINTGLWLEEKGYYSQYLYGRNYKIVSPRAEALGEALTVLFDIADSDRQNKVVAHTPVTDFGIPCIFPQIPRIPSYHNDGVWPFVQAFWSLATAKTGNEEGLTRSLDALYRAAGLFLSNKENFAAHSGDYEGTLFNSDRQLWSVAGNLGMVFKVFFGMEFQQNRLVLNPFVPEKYTGRKKITGFKYRDAILEIELEGHGSHIKNVTLDGSLIQEAVIPADLQGEHHLQIKLTSENQPKKNINLVENAFSPATPKVRFEEGKLSWEPVPQAKQYTVLRNGAVFHQSEKTFVFLNEKTFGEYQVIAIDTLGLESFASEPLAVSNWISQDIDFSSFFSNPLTLYAGFSGKGYVPINRTENNELEFDLEIKDSGTYALSFVYSNGQGPLNTDNKCALRSLKLNGQQVGTLVFPQRGTENWEDWGKSNAVQLALEKGNHTLSISLGNHNQNMNSEINEAMLDQVQLKRIQ